MRGEFTRDDEHARSERYEHVLQFALYIIAVDEDAFLLFDFHSEATVFELLRLQDEIVRRVFLRSLRIVDEMFQGVAVDSRPGKRSVRVRYKLPLPDVKAKCRIIRFPAAPHQIRDSGLLRWETVRSGFRFRI